MRPPLPAGRRAARTAQMPLLDRLLDAEPAKARELDGMGTWTVRALRQAVHRDLEALLNARRPWRSVPSSCAGLRVSPLGYGIPDFTAGAFNETAQREALRLVIEETVRRFEPRLADVAVTVTDEAHALRPTLHLRISARLLVLPAPEPVRFDTALDPATATLTLQMLDGS